MTRHDYQDMSTGYSPLRLATPSGTGEDVQPCVNCGHPVAFRPSGVCDDRFNCGHLGHWRHTEDGHRRCVVTK